MMIQSKISVSLRQEPHAPLVVRERNWPDGALKHRPHPHVDTKSTSEQGARKRHADEAGMVRTGVPRMYFGCTSFQSGTAADRGHCTAEPRSFTRPGNRPPGLSM